jgi:transcriptional regulator with XRE-family HTH domain
MLYTDCRAQFAANLRRARKRADVSQETLGLQAGLHRTEVGLLERAERMPRIDTLVKLGGALGVPPADLLKGIAWEATQATAGRFIETEVPGLGIVHRRFEIGREGNA